MCVRSDARIATRFGKAANDLIPAHCTPFDVHVRVGGAQRRPERRRIRRVQLIHIRTEDIGHHLKNLAIG